MIDIEKINQIALDAGNSILEIYQRYIFNRQLKIEKKADKSPLTEADIKAHSIIAASLKKLTPDVPIFSEEGAQPKFSERKNWDYYWLIDPLDGTKEFIHKNGEFTVNIAFINHHRPVLGVVYAPATDALWYGAEQSGAYKKEGNQKPEKIQPAGIPEFQNTEKSSTWKIAGSRSHASLKLKKYIRRFSSSKIIAMGSSLKICKVADGNIHLYPRFNAVNEWDIAAGHAVLLAAGGDIIDLRSGQSVEYNKNESIATPPFFAAGREILENELIHKDVAKWV